MDNLDDKCVLLGGQPRSGTSLLTSILRSSNDLIQAYELHIRKPSFIVGNNGLYTRNIFKQLGLEPNEFDNIYNAHIDLVKQMNLGAWVGPKEEVSAEQLTGRETNNFNDELLARGYIVSHLMRRTAFLHGKPRWGFKILGDIIYSDKYANVWPNAYFLLLVRDPRDHALSVMKLNEQRKEKKQQNFYDDFRSVAEGWKYTINKGMETLVNSKLKYITIRYEDLVDDPNSVIMRLSEFLDVDLRQGLEFYKQDFVLTHAKRFSHHDNLMSPINKESVGKWKKYMSKDEAEIFKDIAKDEMQKWGYLNN